MQNRLESSINNMSNYVESLRSSERIMDADYAHETAEMTRLQVMQQAGVAALGRLAASARVSFRFSGRKQVPGLRVRHQRASRRLTLRGAMPKTEPVGGVISHPHRFFS